MVTLMVVSLSRGCRHAHERGDAMMKESSSAGWWHDDWATMMVTGAVVHCQWVKRQGLVEGWWGEELVKYEEEHHCSGKKVLG